MEINNTTNRDEAKAFYRVGEVAHKLAICKSLAYQLVSSGEIPSIRLAGRKAVRIPAVALQKWIEDQTRNSHEEGA